MPSASYATSYYLVTTGQATANTQLDVNHDRIWSFAPVWDWQLGGGNFTIKKGSQTALDAILTLYVSFGQPEQAQVAQVRVSPQAVDTSYAPVAFYFAAPATLTAGNNYSLVLTSPTPDTGSAQYFIKGQDNNFNDFTFQDGTGGALPQTDPSAAAAPEPATSVLIGGGIVVAAYLRRKLS